MDVTQAVEHIRTSGLDARLGAPQATVPVEGARFVEAMACLPAGTTVVATDGPGGRFGQTVTAVCSVTASPPSVLFCIKEASPLYGAVGQNGCFSVNVLGVDQRDLADTFAGRAVPPGIPYGFDAGWRSGRTGSPVRPDGAAALDCVLAFQIRVGTHCVCLGHVMAASAGGGEALTYGRRSYGRHHPVQ